jgi:protein TonB
MNVGLCSTIQGDFGSADSRMHVAFSQPERRTPFINSSLLNGSLSIWKLGITCSLGLHAAIGLLIGTSLFLAQREHPPTTLTFHATFVDFADFAEKSSSPNPQSILPALSLPRPETASPAKPVNRKEPSAAKAVVPVTFSTKKSVPTKSDSSAEASTDSQTASTPVLSGISSPSPTGASSIGGAAIGGAESVGALRNSYAQVIASRLEKAKRFPARALQRRIEGDVMLLLRVASDGNVVTSAIKGSSGFEILDGEVLRMVDRASPFPRPPETLVSSNRLEYLVPISFRLRS